MSIPSTEKNTTNEVVKRGKALYEQDIRASVEAGNIGKYLIINVETGEYEIGDDDLETSRRARAKYPDAPLYGMKIGYPAVDAVGAILHPLSEINEAKNGEGHAA